MTQDDEDDVLAELDALVAEEEIKLPDVPADNLPEVLEHENDEEEISNEKLRKVKEKPDKVLIEVPSSPTTSLLPINPISLSLFM